LCGCISSIHFPSRPPFTHHNPESSIHHNPELSNGFLIRVI